MARIVAVANQKGGVGKTTTAINLAASVATRGHRVLLVDFDPQGNASSGVGYTRDRIELTVYDAICGDVAMADVIRPTQITTLWVAPANTELVGAEIELIGADRRERFLADALAPVLDRFDYVVIDCPPSLGILTLNALVAADGVLVPMQAEYFALEGLSALTATIEKVRAAYNPHLAIDGVLFTMYDGRMNLSNDVRGEVAQHFGAKVFATAVPRNVRLSEAPSHGKPALLYDLRSPGARSYLAVAEEFLSRTQTAQVAALGERIVIETEGKKRGLGRGLSALLPSAPGAPASERVRTYFSAQIEDVYPAPDQPRRRFPDVELEQLAASIRLHGVIMPLVVRPRREGGYTLIAGERRWRAAQRAGLHEIPVVIQDVDPREAFERALVENVQRQDLDPLEEAAAYHRLTTEFALTQDQVAERVGKDRSTVANALRLLKLPAPVRELVEARKLTMGHARALLALSTARDMEMCAREVVARALSVRATEALVKKRQAGETARPARAGAPTKSASVRDLEERLTRALGGPVTLTEDAPGKGGRIELRYLDLDHLDRLLDRLL